MTGNQLQGPFCQSCGMPLAVPEDFGTDVVGYRVNDYCHFCFANGVFTEPRATVSDMIDRCAVIMAQRGIMSQDRARTRMTEVLPRLKRWRQVQLSAP